MTDLVETFLEYLESVRGHAKSTVIAYRGDLKQFFEVVKKDPLDVNKADVQQFIMNQKKVDKSARTINRRLDCLSTFFSYLQNDLELDVKMPVRPEYKQKVKNKVSARTSRIAPEDAKRMMEVVRPLDKPAFLAMLLMGKQGLRIGEVRRLKLEHIDFHENLLRVIGSKGEDREIPLVESVKVAIKEEVGHRQTGFVVTWGKGLNVFATNSGLWKRVRFWMDKLGVIGTPHSWRRCAGTELYRKTKDIVLVQQFLGHRSIETTRQSYVDDTAANDQVRRKLDEIF